MADMKKITGMSDEAVKAKTGKAWREWFAVLDKAGAKKMAHRDIAQLLYEKHKVPGWWCQMVTVGYERARGLRQVHQTATGYSVSRSKTIAAPVGKLFRAWQDRKLRGRWLKHKLTIRKATRNKSLRITWADGKTHVDVMFYPKGAGRTQVNVQHNKLPAARDVSAKKTYWAERLDRLAAAVGVAK